MKVKELLIEFNQSLQTKKLIKDFFDNFDKLTPPESKILFDFINFIDVNTDEMHNVTGIQELKKFMSAYNHILSGTPLEVVKEINNNSKKFINFFLNPRKISEVLELSERETNDPLKNYTVDKIKSAIKSFSDAIFE